MPGQSRFLCVHLFISPISSFSLLKIEIRTSLAVQRLRMRLSMQRTQVQSLVQEDSTCHGASRPNATAAEPMYPRARALKQEKPLQWTPPRLSTTAKSSPRLPQLGKLTQSTRDLLLLLLRRFSRARLLATPWTAAYQAPPSMGFSRQENWSGVPLPSPTKDLAQP